MNFAIGIVIAFGSMFGGYAALGGHLEVLVQPFEFVIICGASLGVFIVANPFSTIKDAARRSSRRSSTRFRSRATISTC